MLQIKKTASKTRRDFPIYSQLPTTVGLAFLNASFFLSTLTRETTTTRARTAPFAMSVDAPRGVEHSFTRESGTPMFKRASSSQVFQTMSLSLTSSEKKICPIQRTLRHFAW